MTCGKPRVTQMWLSRKHCRQQCRYQACWPQEESSHYMADVQRPDNNIRQSGSAGEPVSWRALRGIRDRRDDREVFPPQGLFKTLALTSPSAECAYSASPPELSHSWKLRVIFSYYAPMAGTLVPRSPLKSASSRRQSTRLRYGKRRRQRNRGEENALFIIELPMS